MRTFIKPDGKLRFTTRGPQGPVQVETSFDQVFAEVLRHPTLVQKWTRAERADFRKRLFGPKPGEVVNLREGEWTDVKMLLDRPSNLSIDLVDADADAGGLFFGTFENASTNIDAKKSKSKSEEREEREEERASA